jgi:hypothetical protein
MNVRQFIRQPKQIIEAGKWADGGTRGMPKSAFPLSKSRSFQLGKKWRWRVDRVAVEDTECRLLTAFEPAHEKFMAWLSICRGADYAIVARYEFHGDEPGWHVHSTCGRVSQIPVAVVKPYGTMRLPKASDPHRRNAFTITEMDAVSVSFRVFRVMALAEDGFL